MRQHSKVRGSSARSILGSARLYLESLERRDVPTAVGVLDPTFGTGGQVIALYNTSSRAQAVAVDSLGRVVVAGYTPGTGGNDFVVLRFNSDGTPDTAFGTGGKETLDFAGGDDAAGGVAIDPNGNIVVVGTSTTGGRTQLAVARLTPAGRPDPTFGAGVTGEVLIPPPSGYTDLTGTVYGYNQLMAGPAVAIDASGNIVLAGTADTGTGSKSQFAVARLTPAGALDPAFNGGAVEVLGVSATSVDSAAGVTMNRAGDIVVAGGSFDPAAFAAVGRAAVFELRPDGTLDPAFNGGKILTVGTGHGDTARAVATDAAGDVYLAGSSTVDNGFPLYGVLSVFKVTPAGAEDPTFGNGGVFLADPRGNRSSEAIAIAVQANGRVDVGGITAVGFAHSFVVLQLLPAGALDPAFNAAGSTPGENSFFFGGDPGGFLYGLTATPSGQVVVAGGDDTTFTPGRVEIARLTGPGRLDVSTELAVSGSPDGTAQLFGSTAATGQVNTTALATIAAFGSATVNVRTAVADVNGDGIPDTIVVTGPGVPLRVAVVSGADNKTLLVQPFDPFGGNFTGGGFVTAGDFGHTGRANFVVTPDEGGGPRVSLFALGTDGTVSTVANFFGIADPNFRGGARAAAGDVNGDGTPDLVVAAGFGGGPRVAVFNGTTLFTTPTRLVNDFFAFPGADATTLRNGVYVAVGDVTGDGYDDLIFGGGPGGAPRVFILSGVQVVSGSVTAAQANPVANFFVAGNTSDRGGVRVAAKNLDGDTEADVVVASGQGSPAKVRVYLGKTFPAPGEPGTFQDLGVSGGATLADGVYVG
ncbi:MAG: uncharacterized protein JWO38_6453 [Gemmataceae bacterium]|nr:uncharacterized protein [Gemmataceae bacterium]